LAAACTNLTPPDDVNPTVSLTPVRPSAGFFEWRVPKTVLDTTVSYVYKGCTQDKTDPTRVALNAAVSVEIDAKGIPDDNPFGDHSGAWVRVPLSDVQSFWQDRSLSIKKNANGTLASITSTPTNNVGAIIGNVLTTGAKVASVVMGVPAVGGGVRGQQCNPQFEALAKQASDLDTRIKSGALTQKQATDATAQLQALQARLTLTVKKTIDPGVTPIGDDVEPPKSIGADGKFAELKPELKDLNQWVVGDPLDVVPFTVTLSLDFASASPSIVRTCPVAPAGCERRPVAIDRETHFREPAYIPIKVERGGMHAFDPANRKVQPLPIKVAGDAAGGNAIAFAQFGLPRNVPIGAGLFQKFNIQVSFDQFGGTSDQTAASDAVGTRLTSFLGQGAAAANSVATENRNAITQPDTETLKAQAEAARLNAQLTLAKARSDYAAAQAQGKVP
jgi:hypothetical protein